MFLLNGKSKKRKYNARYISKRRYLRIRKVTKKEEYLAKYAKYESKRQHYKIEKSMKEQELETKLKV